MKNSQLLERSFHGVIKNRAKWGQYEEIGLGVFKEFVGVFMESMKHSQINEIKLNYHLLRHLWYHELVWVIPHSNEHE